jgi:hypothetical protein
MPVVRNLGTNHQELTKSTWARLHHDFAALWTRFPAPGPGPLEIADAAAHAADALRATFPPGSGPSEGRWELVVATRGDRPAPAQFTIDATDLLGGARTQARAEAAWARIFSGLCDLKDVLTAHGHRREVLLRPTCHLSAAFAAGWVFRRSAGWKLAVAFEGDESSSAESRGHEGLVIAPPEYGTFRSSGGRLVVCIDLVPRWIRDSVMRAQVAPPRALLAMTVRNEGRRIAASDFGAMAGASAAAIKRLRGEIRAEELALYLATPAPFAALLGAELGALGCPICLHEYDGAGYQPSISIPG